MWQSEYKWLGTWECWGFDSGAVDPWEVASSSRVGVEPTQLRDRKITKKDGKTPSSKLHLLDASHYSCSTKEFNGVCSELSTPKCQTCLCELSERGQRAAGRALVKRKDDCQLSKSAAEDLDDCSTWRLNICLLGQDKPLEGSSIIIEHGKIQTELWISSQESEQDFHCGNHDRRPLSYCAIAATQGSPPLRSSRQIWRTSDNPIELSPLHYTPELHRLA